MAINTVRSRYHAVNFLPNPLKIHPIAHPLGWGMGCILWAQIVIYTLSKPLQWYMQYHILLDRLITAPNEFLFFYIITRCDDGISDENDIAEITLNKWAFYFLIWTIPRDWTRLLKCLDLVEPRKHCISWKEHQLHRICLEYLFWIYVVYTWWAISIFKIQHILIEEKYVGVDICRCRYDKTCPRASGIFKEDTLTWTNYHQYNIKPL